MQRRYRELLPVILAGYAVAAILALLVFMPYRFLSPAADLLLNITATAGVTAILVYVIQSMSERRIAALVESTIGLKDTDVKYVRVVEAEVLSEGVEERLLQSLKDSFRIRMALSTDSLSASSLALIRLVEHAVRQQDISLVLGRADSASNSESSYTDDQLFDRFLLRLRARGKPSLATKFISSTVRPSFILTDDDLFLFISPSQLAKQLLFIQCAARSRLGSDYEQVFNSMWAEARDVVQGT
jgi:hypothetical protein